MNADDSEVRGSGEPTSLFREEALEHHRQGSRLEGDIVRISPAWLT